MAAPSRAALGIALAVVAVGAVLGAACAPRGGVGSTAAPRAEQPTAQAAAVGEELHGRLDGTDRTAWIALATTDQGAPVSATARWRIDEQGGRQALVRGTGGERWRIERRDGLLRIAGDGDDATPWRVGPLVASAADGEGFVQYRGKRYRGQLWFTATDSGVLVVNRLPLEDYLRGVVPLELGTRQATDRAAMEAQAIAARSYAYIRVPNAGSVQPQRGYHMLATVANQAYGGVDVENPLVDQAVNATTGLVLRYGGLTVDAPYSAACGGRTASPREAWRDARDEPYLQSVDDIDLSTGRPFCDISPRNHWVQELNELQLSDAVRRALASQGARNPQATGVRGVVIVDRSTSGRVGALVFRTDRGDITIRARDVRAVLRDARGAILSSTYFSVDREAHAGEKLTGLTLRGNGNGHGVGMCQWGAIGRARAGQDARTILRHYYPGTNVGFAD